MNYTMGRYIDELDEEGRDRLVTALDLDDGPSFWDDATGCGCLVGTAENFGALPTVDRVRQMLRFEFGVKWTEVAPPYRFPRACIRFGKARVVRAVKARAGARIPLAPPTPSETNPAEPHALTDGRTHGDPELL